MGALYDLSRAARTGAGKVTGVIHEVGEGLFRGTVALGGLGVSGFEHLVGAEDAAALTEFQNLAEFYKATTTDGMLEKNAVKYLRKLVGLLGIRSKEMRNSILLNLREEYVEYHVNSFISTPRAEAEKRVRAQLPKTMEDLLNDPAFAYFALSVSGADHGWRFWKKKGGVAKGFGYLGEFSSEFAIGKARFRS